MRIFFHFEESSSPENIHQFAFSAPKKLFSNATDRNAIKRLMREVVRLNKTGITAQFINKSGVFFISYININKPSFENIETSVNALFKKIKK